MNDDGALEKWRDNARSLITESMNAHPDVWAVDASEASEDGCGGGDGDSGADDSGADSGATSGATEVASISPSPLCW